MSNPDRVIVIAGPTTSGKSALALALAERLGGIVINADSMQVYRELRILTARPGEAEMARAPHRLYGSVPASESHSVGRWLVDVSHELAEARKAGHPAIITGGTGLYFDALENGLADIAEIPPDIRAHWRDRLAREGPASLHRVLAERDPGMALRLKPSDGQRLVRALEVIEATGRSLGEAQAESANSPLPATGVTKLVLMPPRPLLNERIEARVDQMMAEGALDEVVALRAMALDSDLPAMKALGIKRLSAHLDGHISLAEAVTGLKTDTRRYAKRQTTWARGRMGHWRWIEGEDACSSDRAFKLANVENGSLDEDAL